MSGKDNKNINNHMTLITQSWQKSPDNTQENFIEIGRINPQSDVVRNCHLCKIVQNNIYTYIKILLYQLKRQMENRYYDFNFLFF
jgi:hypothetical protein